MVITSKWWLKPSKVFIIYIWYISIYKTRLRAAQLATPAATNDPSFISQTSGLPKNLLLESLLRIHGAVY